MKRQALGCHCDSFHLLLLLCSVNPQLYRSTVEQLGAVMERQVAESPMALSSGVVVNSMGWIEGLGYDLLLHSIQALKVDTVLVLGQERLYSMLRGLYAGNGVDVVKLARSGGVVARDKVYRSKRRDSRTRVRRQCIVRSL